MNKKTIKMSKDMIQKNERKRILVSISENSHKKAEIWHEVNGIYKNLIHGGKDLQYKKRAVDTIKYLNKDTMYYECRADSCGFRRPAVSGSPGEQSSNKRAFCKHVLDHEKPLMECPYECSYSTKVKASLVQHIQRKHNSCKYKCPRHSCLFIDKCSMYGNVATHYGRAHINKKYVIKTSANFECVKCNFSNKSSGMFYIHLAKCVGPFKEIGSGGSRKCESVDMRKETRLVIKV